MPDISDDFQLLDENFWLSLVYPWNTSNTVTASNCTIDPSLLNSTSEMTNLEGTCNKMELSTKNINGNEINKIQK